MILGFKGEKVHNTEVIIEIVWRQSLVDREGKQRYTEDRYTNGITKDFFIFFSLRDTCLETLDFALLYWGGSLS